MAPVICRDCSMKIGLFKKKYTCQQCSYRFCDKCFSKVKENASELAPNRTRMTGQNCLACIVLQCGQIKREQLFLLRNKQLTLYLTERNISTENCSEKYHLVDLIMEFAETHGLKSGDDLESDVLHRDHVAALKRQAELLQEDDTSSETSEDPENDIREGDTEDENSVQPEFDQPHFSGTEHSNRAMEDETGINPTPQTMNDEDDEIEEMPSQPGTSREEEEDLLSAGATQGNQSAKSSPHHQASGHWKSVEDITMEEDINSLSVLELKQILAANFIDYRGCVEKSELITKVTMLYQSQKAEKSVEDKPDRDLCKICMDRTIDCVFLDCAHLVACTKCGKQLSECPICRAYIVRVVHIFRA